jgi:expansin (peptidoglycan-binding protein)
MAESRAPPACPPEPARKPHLPAKLPRMAHRPGGTGRIPRRLLAGRRRLGLGAATVLGAAAIAVAVGISQATTAPACASVSVPGAAQGPASPRQARVSGEATHYVLEPGDGNCSFPGLPAGQLYVALSPGEYGSAAACGSYVQVTGPDGSVTAEVVDQCPPCQAGHVDLSEAAFAKIAPLAAGLVPVTYHVIASPPLAAPLSLRVKEGSSAYWLALLPIGSGNPVTSVRVSSASRGWQELAHASYDYWLAPSGMGPGPFTVQLTDSAGHQATVTGITLSPGVVQATRTWMYGAGAAPAGTAGAITPAASASPAAPARPAPDPSPGPAGRPAESATAVSPAALSPAAVIRTPSCQDPPSAAGAAPGRSAAGEGR